MNPLSKYFTTEYAYVSPWWDKFMETDLVVEPSREMFDDLVKHLPKDRGCVVIPTPHDAHPAKIAFYETGWNGVTWRQVSVLLPTGEWLRAQR